jgi:mycothione reductase
LLLLTQSTPEGVHGADDRNMKEYDVIVIGSGCGIIIVNKALAHGLKTALVDKGPLGGTCLNYGCIPSKILTTAANRVLEIQESTKLGIKSRVVSLDFKSIMQGMRKNILESRQRLRANILRTPSLDLFEDIGTFTGDLTLEVKGEAIRGKKIFIASGARPFIPQIEGLDKTDYLTNETLLQLNEKPESLLIIGGGYVGVEYGHFFAAMGTKVTIIEMAERLVPLEEPEISELLRNKLSQRMEVYTRTAVIKGQKQDSSYRVLARDVTNNHEKEYSAEKILIAAGRTPNTDLLNAGKTGIQVDNKGFIMVNEYLETTRRNIYAVGDANGKQMFTHVANREAFLAANNALHDEWVKMDFSASPHAIFSYPQVASVGLTEIEARKKYRVQTGKARYYDHAMGLALQEKDGFAKAIIEKETGRILGFHIIGPEASILIQEVVNVMAARGTLRDIRNGMHIHPALSEVIQSAFSHTEE